jgi:hypothetical protein
MLAYVKNRTLHELRRVRAAYRFRNSREFSVDLPQGPVRSILQRHGIGFAADGTATWWLASLDLRRNEEDDLTKTALRYVETEIDKDAAILGTGCGTGWMLYWFVQRGFRNVEGFDYLPNVVESAKEIAATANIPARIWQADGFAPRLERNYDVVLVLHWLYSAWMGNYGNQQRQGDRESLLWAFLEQYVGHMNPGALMLLELVDAISDHMVPQTKIYPVRHSAEQVERCATKLGLKIEAKFFNCKYGHLPRMLYALRKS